MSSLLLKARSSCGTIWNTFFTSQPSLSMDTDTIHSTLLAGWSTNFSLATFTWCLLEELNGALGDQRVLK